ncbi:SDR family NAD(P)-dependent oxidoreductase [Lysobacter korlensis]|uniref:2-C-methyl-D-erythritol 4-phosphate cytidylyltransferase n=1 Tax=Lysobacter korlensis TaxID=553636 RepID=A0ABV6RZI2_9GAMM
MASDDATMDGFGPSHTFGDPDPVTGSIPIIARRTDPSRRSLRQQGPRVARTFGVILAGGVGTRVGLKVPKQLVKVAGKTILEHTVTVFEQAPEIDEIIVMITPGWESRIRDLLGDRYPKVGAVLAGGETRNETTRLAIEAIGSDDAKLIMHDAVRPLLDPQIIADCVTALDSYAAVDVVIPSADTLVEVDDHDIITAIPDRSRFRRGQTPQAFRLGVLREAYGRAARDYSFRATDDCGVVLHYMPEVPIKTVTGAEHNIKVTYPVDLYIADRLFQLRSAGTPTYGTAASREDALRGKVFVVFGGSYGIGGEICRLAAEHGAHVVEHSRSSTGLDIRDAEKVRAAIEAAASAHGRIDAVIVTAGVLKMGPLSETDDDEIRESIDVNYVGPIHIAKASYPHLAATGGHLLYFTSSSYTRGRKSYAVYSSAKAAVVNLTQALAEEWTDERIKVNVINPERTATPMRTQAFGDEEATTLLSAEAVAEASLDVIASDATGQVFDVRLEPAEA